MLRERSSLSSSTLECLIGDCEEDEEEREEEGFEAGTSGGRTGGLKQASKDEQ